MRSTFKRGPKGGGSGGSGGGTQPAPVPDTTPDAFTFTAVTDAELSTVTSSNAVTLTGMGAAASITGSTGLQYTVDGGAHWLDLPGTVQPNPTLAVRGESSSQNSVTLGFSVDVGGVTATFEVRTKAADAAPPEDAILFGIGTRSGFGGWPLDLTAASAITGTGASDWVINSAGELTPSGTYGAAKSFSKTAGQSYSLTFADAVTRTVTLVAAQAHCAANAADTSTSFQLRTYLTTAGLTGDIVCRNGRMNPTGALWRIRPPAAGYGGAIVVRSENPTSGNDADGNPIRGGGFQIGALAFDPSLLLRIPVTFEDVTFYNDVDGTHSAFLGYTTTTGTGVGATRCRFENAPNVSLAYANNCFTARGATVQDSAFVRARKGVTGGLLDGLYETRVRDCTFKNMTADGVQLIGQNQYVTGILEYDALDSGEGEHPDGVQHLGATAATFTLPIVVEDNIFAQNTGAWYQGIFLSDTISPYWMTAVSIQRNIFLVGQRGITLTRGSGAGIRNNLILRMPGHAPSLGNASVDISTCETTTIDSNVANSFSLGANSGFDNVTLPATLAAYQTAMPAFPTDVAAPGFTTRAAVLAACTPANLAIASGGFKKPDGSYAGPLNAAGAYQ